MNLGRALIAFLCLAAGIAILASCGGGHSASGGSGGTGMMARGSISRIGSIFVNGVEYDTTGATITLPGGSSYVDHAGTAGGTDLMEGMIVTVVGSVADDGLHGTATAVTYNRSLIGEMLTDAPGAGFTLYGQQVVYDPDIRFESQAGVQTTLVDPIPVWVTNNTGVEVSGFVLADGSVQASYVKELAELPTDLEIEGFVSAVNGQVSIVVGGTTFSMPGGHDWVENPIEVGTYVGVHFDLPVDATVSNLIATEVEIEEMELAGAEGELGELEGVITAGGNPFTIAGQQVYTDASTRYEGGVAGDLAAGRKIEVLGSFSGGRFVAQEIEFE